MLQWSRYICHIHVGLKLKVLKYIIANHAKLRKALLRIYTNTINCVLRVFSVWSSFLQNKLFLLRQTKTDLKTMLAEWKLWAVNVSRSDRIVLSNTTNASITLPTITLNIVPKFNAKSAVMCKTRRPRAASMRNMNCGCARLVWPAFKWTLWLCSRN